MKIALELQPAIKNRTGVGWYTYELIKRLKSSENEYFAYIFNFLERNDLNRELGELNIETVVSKYIPYGIYNRLWNYVPISYNNLFPEKADIYHFFNFLVPPRVKGKVIVTVYDMVYKQYPETMAKKNIARLERDLIRSVNRADIIITISENSKKEIIEYLNIPESKIEIVYPGVELQQYNKTYSAIEKECIKKKYNLPEEYILYLGTLEPRKNIESIIDSYAQYKKNYTGKLKLIIAGKKGWMFESIFEMVKKNNLQEDIIFIGYVDERDKPLLYKMSRMFIFPSLYEGFGMPVLEAMAAGVPVITSNNSSIPEVAGEAAILLNAQDIEGMVVAINQLDKDSSLRKKLILEGLKQSSKFTWENSIEQLISVYNKMK